MSWIIVIFLLAGAQIIRKENCFFLTSEKITATWQCFDLFVNKVRDLLIIKRFRQIAMEEPIRVMRCESNVRMKSKAWVLSLVPHFSLSQLRLTFLKLGEFHARSRLARSTIPEGKCVAQGGLAVRSGTDFTWSPQLRNVDEWDWVPIFLQNKYGGECRHGRPTSFCSVLSFPVSKHQEKFFMNFFNGIFGHQVAWCLNSLWVTSLIVIQRLGKFSYF